MNSGTSEHTSETSAAVDEEKPEPADESAATTETAQSGGSAGSSNQGPTVKGKRRMHLLVATALVVVLVTVVVVPVSIIKSRGDANSSAQDDSADGGSFYRHALVSDDELLDISAGSSHTCAIRVRDNKVFCWGSITAAQKNLAALQLVSGDDFICAIKKGDSGVRCWGNRLMMEPPEDLGAVSSLAVGTSFICGVLRRDSSVRCWGYAEGGMDNSTTVLDNLGEVQEIDASVRWACAIHGDNSSSKVHCWNYDYYEAEDAVIVPPDLEPVSSIAISYRKPACAVMTKDKTMRCWRTPISNDDENKDPLHVPSGEFVEVGTHSGREFCGVSTDGIVTCWNIIKGEEEMAGGGYATWHHPPPDLGAICKLTIGSIHACAIRREDNRGVCWGHPDYIAPKVISPLRVKTVDAGSSRTCAILEEDNSIRCWGHLAGYIDYGSLSAAKAVGAGWSEFDCFIRREDNNLECVGPSSMSEWHVPKEVGRVSQFDMSVDFDVAYAVRERDGMVIRFSRHDSNAKEYPLFGVAKSVHIGRGLVACAIGVDNTLVCDDSWYNWTTPPKDLGPVADVTLGDHFICALKADATIKCWGRSEYYVASVAANIPVGSFTAIASAKSGVARVVCAILALSKTVSCWGSPMATAVLVPDNLGPVKYITGGGKHFCVIREGNNALTCWGGNGSGQLAPEYN